MSLPPFSPAALTRLLAALPPDWAVHPLAPHLQTSTLQEELVALLALQNISALACLRAMPHTLTFHALKGRTPHLLRLTAWPVYRKTPESAYVLQPLTTQEIANGALVAKLLPYARDHRADPSLNGADVLAIQLLLQHERRVLWPRQHATPTQLGRRTDGRLVLLDATHLDGTSFDAHAYGAHYAARWLMDFPYKESPATLGKVLLLNDGYNRQTLEAAARRRNIKVTCLHLRSSSTPWLACVDPTQQHDGAALAAEFAYILSPLTAETLTSRIARAANALQL